MVIGVGSGVSASQLGPEKLEEPKKKMKTKAARRVSGCVDCAMGRNHVVLVAGAASRVLIRSW